MERYFRLKIPFGTKSYIRKFETGLKMFATANFIYDREQNLFVDWYIKLIQSNFRMTDLRMTKPTEYYKSKIVKDFRTNILDKFYGINNTNEIIHKELTDEQIEIVNKELRKIDLTIKGMFSLLSGSNISGAEQNHRATPMICNDIKYFECNFANVIKHYESNKKTFIDDTNIRAYDLDEVIKAKLIPKFKEKFNGYNEWWLYKDYDLNVDYLEEYNQSEFNNYLKDDLEFTLSIKQEDCIYAIINKTYANFKNENDDVIKARLRSFYKSNIKKFLKDKKIPLLSTKQKYNLSVIVNAHIIPFNDLYKKNTYNSLKDAVNPYNCLRIDRNTHELFDSNNFFFNSNGDFIDREGRVRKKGFLDIENMPAQTKFFFNQIKK